MNEALLARLEHTLTLVAARDGVAGVAGFMRDAGSALAARGLRAPASDVRLLAERLDVVDGGERR